MFVTVFSQTGSRSFSELRGSGVVMVLLISDMRDWEWDALWCFIPNSKSCLGHDDGAIELLLTFGIGLVCGRASHSQLPMLTA